MTALDPALHAVARGLLAGVLLHAAWHKLREPGSFRAALADYALLPAAALPAVAATLPWLEVALALGLLLPATRALASLAAAGLLGVYTTAIAVNLWRGRRWIDCGCAGAAVGRGLDEWLLLRNALLVGLAGLVAVPPGLRPLGVADGLGVAAGTAGALLLYASVDGLLALAPRLRALRGSR